MKTKILPNIFISAGVLFVVTDFVAAAVRHYKLAAEGRLLAARTSDGVLNSGNMPLRLPIITSDAPDAGTGPNQGQRPIPTPRQAGSFCSPLFLRIARHNSPHPGPESHASKKKIARRKPRGKHPFPIQELGTYNENAIRPGKSCRSNNGAFPAARFSFCSRAST